MTRSKKHAENAAGPKKAPATDLVCANSVTGKLEQIHSRGKKPKFNLCDLGHSIECNFPEEMLGQAQNALGRYVEIYGDYRYRDDMNFPYKVKVERLKVFPPSDQLPSLSDLCGIAPDATGGKSSEDFVRELRDEWD